MDNRSFTYNNRDKRTPLPQLSELELTRQEKIEAMLSRRYNDVCLVLEDIYNPHNANAVFRTCDAFGVQTIHLIFNHVPFYDPYTIEKKASTSSGKWVDIHTYSHPDHVIELLKKEQYSIFAAVVPEQADAEIMNADFGCKTAIVLGNEINGVSENFLLKAHQKIAIPRLGMAQSLNISVAAGIFLYEMHRQRHSRTISSKAR